MSFEAESPTGSSDDRGRMLTVADVSALARAVVSAGNDARKAADGIIALEKEVAELREDLKTTRGSSITALRSLVSSLKLTNTIAFAVLVGTIALAGPIALGGFVLAVTEPAALFDILAKISHAELPAGVVSPPSEPTP